MTITSRYDGVVKKLHHAVDSVAKVGQALVDIELDGSSEKQPEATEKSKKKREPRDEEKLSSSSESSDEEEKKFSNFGKILATPAVRRIAMENKVNLYYFI